MGESAAFQWICEALERFSSLNRLEARGTIRIALKEAGLESRSLTSGEAEVVIKRLLPDELRVRGIEAEGTIKRLADELRRAGLSDDQTADSPESVFKRLGRD